MVRTGGGKKLITNKKDFDMLKKLMTKDDFYDNFKLSINLVTKLVAEDAVKDSVIRKN
jgi:hypothetical protein